MTKRSEKMATWPIPKLLFSMGIPAVFSMLIQALYNIVDTVFISQYSQDAMFAIGLAFPLQMTGLSLALGLGVGTGTLVSRRLGEKRKEEASKVASTSIILALIQVILVILVGLFLTKPFLHLFTDRPEIIELGYSYLSIVLIFNFGQMFSVVLERIMQAQGDMITPMMALITGAVTNIILDPIFIFGYFGIPEMGIAGAAIATVIGQIAGCLVVVYAAVRGHKHEIKFNFKGFKWDMVVVRDIYSVGLPTAIMNMISSVTTTLMNGVLVNFSELAVTSLSLYFKLQSFVFMPVFGFNQGALPILSYNFGARDRKRYLETGKLYLATAFVFMFIGTILFTFTPKLMLSFFETTPELDAIAVVTLKRIALSFIPAAFGISMSTMFQSLGRGTTSMIQSICRQLIFLIPAAYVLANLGLDAVWYAYVIAEVLVCIIFAPILYKVYQNVFR